MVAAALRRELGCNPHESCLRRKLDEMISLYRYLKKTRTSPSEYGWSADMVNHAALMVREMKSFEKVSCSHCLCVTPVARN